MDTICTAWQQPLPLCMALWQHYSRHHDVLSTKNTCATDMSYIHAGINFGNYQLSTILLVMVVCMPDCLAMVQGAYSHSLAEWALTACSWFAKDLPRLKQQQKDRNWEPYFVEELRQAIQLCQALLLLSLFANEGCLIRLHLTGRLCLDVLKQSHAQLLLSLPD